MPLEIRASSASQLDLLGDAVPAPDRGQGKRGPKNLAAGAIDHPTVRRTKASELGKGLPVLRRIERNHKGDPLRQVDEFFYNFRIPAAIGRQRTVGIKTEEAYIDMLRVSVRTLSKLNMGVENLSELSRRHVASLFLHWEQLGRSASDLTNKNTKLRRFGIWCGKPDLCPQTKYLVRDPSRLRRASSATESKAWEARGIDIDELFRRMDEECVYAGLQLRLMLHFGLRVEEAVMLRPLSADLGDFLHVVDGTKGGRGRDVRVNTHEQRRLVEQAKAMAADNKYGLLAPNGRRKLDQAKRHFRHLCEKLGLTKDALGITPHGLRHQFANHLYKSITGTDSPVNGGVVLSLDEARSARKSVSLQLGHSKPGKANAYCGTHTWMAHSKRVNMDSLVKKLESSREIRDAVAAAGIGTLRVVGPAATGEPMGAYLMVCAQDRAGQDLGAESFEGVRALMGQRMGRACVQVTQSVVDAEDMPTLELTGLTRHAMPGQALALTTGTGAASGSG